MRRSQTGTFGPRGARAREVRCRPLAPALLEPAVDARVAIELPSVDAQRDAAQPPRAAAAVARLLDLHPGDVADAHPRHRRVVDRHAVRVAIAALEVVVETLVEREPQVAPEPQEHVVVGARRAYVRRADLDLDGLDRLAFVRDGRNGLEPRERLVRIREREAVVAVDDGRGHRLPGDPRPGVHVGVVGAGIAEPPLAHVQHAQDDDPRIVLHLLA